MIPQTNKLYRIDSKGLKIKGIAKFLRINEDGLYSFVFDNNSICMLMEESIIEEVKEK